MKPALVYRQPPAGVDALVYAIGRFDRTAGVPRDRPPVSGSRVTRWLEGWDHMDRALKMLGDDS